MPLVESIDVNAKRIVLAVLLAAATGGLVWYVAGTDTGAGYVPGAGPAAATSAASEREADTDPATGAPPPLPPLQESEASREPVETSVAAAETSSSADTQSERSAEALMNELVTIAYDQTGSRYVEFLVSRGLAPLDSERIIEQAFRDAAACSFDAMRLQAEREAVPFADVLFSVDSMLHGGDGPPITALIDVRAASANALPCLYDVLQEAGLPAELGEQAGAPFAGPAPP